MVATYGAGAEVTLGILTAVCVLLPGEGVNEVDPPSEAYQEKQQLQLHPHYFTETVSRSTHCFFDDTGGCQDESHNHSERLIAS